MEIIRIPCGIHAVSGAGNRLTDRADAPTPACGHPFPKEGELRFGPSCLVRRFFHRFHCIYFPVHFLQNKSCGFRITP
ncbi:MAG: hypothetical protein PUF10_05830 [Bacteroidales bacterium]|nr:hypothetical protein [Bacteroidales bacterium]